MNGSTGAVTMNGGIGTNFFYAGSGVMTANGGAGLNIFVLQGDAAADTILGGSGPNYVYASSDTKALSFKGGTGVDVFYGSMDVDTVEGGGGTLYAWGGTGANSFVVKSGDGVLAIQDWLASSSNLLTLVGTTLHSFTDVQQAETYLSGSNTTVITAGGGTAIWLTGVAPGQLNAGQFSFS